MGFVQTLALAPDAIGCLGRRVTYLGFNRIELTVMLRLDYRGDKGGSTELLGGYRS